MSEDFPGRWFLDDAIDQMGKLLDTRIFTDGLSVEVKSPLKITVGQPGDMVDFNFAAYDMLIVTKALNEKLEKEVGDAIQRIPVIIGGWDKEYEILNITNLVKCIDEKRSIFLKWKLGDHRSDMLGEYRCFYEMFLDPKLANGHKIFRVKEWDIAPIVNEDIMNLIIEHGTTGVSFDPVS